MKKNRGVDVRKIFVLVVTVSLLAGAMPAYAQSTQNNNTNTVSTTKPSDPDQLPFAQSSGQKETLTDLGLEGTQPTVKNGTSEVNQNINPFGPKMVVMEQIRQLAAAGLDINNDEYDIYDKKFSEQMLNALKVANAKAAKAGLHSNKSSYIDTVISTLNSIAVNYSSPILGLKTSGIVASSWYSVPKAMVGADLNGAGTDMLVTAALPPVKKGTCKLELIVTDCNGGSVITGTATIVGSLPDPKTYDTQCQHPIEAVAGDFNHDGKDQIAILVGNTLYFVQVAVSLSGGTMKVDPTILSQATFDSSSSVAHVSNTTKDYPEMDLVAADVNDDGYKDLLVTTGSSDGGSDGNTPKLLIYSDTTNAAKPTDTISLVVNGQIFQSPNVAVGDVLGTGTKDIVIAGRTTPKSKTYLTYITYDSETQEFTPSDIMFRVEASLDHGSLEGLAIAPLDGPDGKAAYVFFGDSVLQYDGNKGSFVDQSVQLPGLSKHKPVAMYVLNMVTGNFDGNIKGRKQVGILYHVRYKHPKIHHDKVYLAWVGESGGKLCVEGQSVAVDNYPTICAPAVYDYGLKMVYQNAVFAFSDPKVLAVLAAPPFYKDISLQTAGSWIPVSTSFSLGSGTTTTTTNSAGFSMGTSVGFSQDVSIFGIRIAGVNFSTEFKTDFKGTWSKSTTYSINSGYIDDVGGPQKGHDAVVVQVIPYDTYYYEAYNYNCPQGQLVAIRVNYEPITTDMDLHTYDQAVKDGDLTSAPYVPSDVLNLTVGDPRSYPGDAGTLSNVQSSGLVKSDEENSPLNTGELTSATIGESSSTGSKFDFTASVNTSAGGSVGGVKLSRSFGYQYGHSHETVHTTSEKFSGDVAGFSNSSTIADEYGFHYELVAYDYLLPTYGDITSDSGKYSSDDKAMVVSYVVNPDGTVPPAAPALQVESKTPTSVTLSWKSVKYPNNPGEDAAGYVIERSTRANGTYTAVKTITSGDTTNFTDSNLVPNTTYYYKALSYNGSPPLDGFPSSPIEVQTPNSLVSNQNQMPLGLKVDFKVGGKDNATALVPNERLDAIATITNNGNTSQQVVFITALYSATGMVDEADSTVDVPANGTANASAQFKLPADVSKATVTAFVWGGKDLKSSSVTLLSNVVKFPS